MTLKIFTQANCPKCPPAKKLGKEIEKEGKLKVEWFDISTVDGLAEASFYSVLSTPSLILVNEAGKEITGWRGQVPRKSEIEGFTSDRLTQDSPGFEANSRTVLELASSS